MIQKGGPSSLPHCFFLFQHCMYGTQPHLNHGKITSAATQYAEAAQSSHPHCNGSSSYASTWRAAPGAAPWPPQSSHSLPHASHEHSSLTDHAFHHAASPISIAHANSPPSSNIIVIEAEPRTIAAASLGNAV